MCACAALCKGMDADHDNSRGELNDNNNSTACLLYNFSQHEYSVIGTTFLVSDIVGLLSSMAAIVLVLVTRAYLVTIYRLILYLSIAALLYLIVAGMMFITSFVTQDSTTRVYVIIVSFLVGYFLLVYVLVLCWIGVHVFLLAVIGVHLQKTKHELFAIAGVLLLPLIVTWAIPVYPSGPCALNPSFLTVVLGGFYLVSTILAALTVISVILSLCKGLLKVKKVNRRALKELAPYLLFIIIQNINSILLLTDYALMMKKERMEKLLDLIETLFFCS